MVNFIWFFSTDKFYLNFSAANFKHESRNIANVYGPILSILKLVHWNILSKEREKHKDLPLTLGADLNIFQVPMKREILKLSAVLY